MKKRMLIMVLSALVLAIAVTVMCKKEAAKKADVRCGEDYMDGRDTAWSLRDTEGKTLVRIKAAKGYNLSGQEYGSCSIVFKDMILGKVELKKDTGPEDALRLLVNDKKYICHDEKSPKGKTFKLVSVGEEAYVLNENKNNTVVIRLLAGNIKKAGMTVEEAGGILIDMID